VRVEGLLKSSPRVLLFNLLFFLGLFFNLLDELIISNISFFDRSKSVNRLFNVQHNIRFLDLKV